MVEGFDYEDVPTDVSLADRKAQEAKEPLTPVEKFVGIATQTNYELFKRALDEAVQETISVFNEDWIPEGDAKELMSYLDNARNFLALAETYFQALATPVMQAATLHMERERFLEATAPHEPTAGDRGLTGKMLVGKRVRMTGVCGAGGMDGTVMAYDPEDGEYDIHVDGDGDTSWHARHCFEVKD